MRILFCDPGKLTGYGLLQWQPSEQPVFLGAELPYNDFIDFVASPFHGLRTMTLDRVVCEGFDITPKTYQTNPNDETLWAVKGLGFLEVLCRWSAIPFERQSRTALHFDKSGDKLKKLGWWQATAPGEKGHRRDAGRHALKWAVDHRVLDPKVLL